MQVTRRTSGEVATDGKTSTFKVGVMQARQKQDGHWRPYVRQAFRLS